MTAAEERQVIEEAAHWYARLLPGADDLGDGARARRDFDRWLAARPQHQAAWDRMQAMGAQLQALPADLAAPVLGRRRRRRTMITGLAWLGGAGLATALGERAWRAGPWGGGAGEVATGTGERRRIALVDGSTVDVDALTTVEVEEGTTLRRVLLRDGRVLVTTRPDHHVPPRPFVVVTAHGRILALGTRFEVKVTDSATVVSVLTDAVRVSPAGALEAGQTVDAGERLRFSATAISAPASVEAGAGAWSRGQLVLADVPLAQVVAELDRYHRHGWIRCDPAIADLRISGVLPLDDTGQALASLAETFSMRIVRSWGGMRIRVEAARAAQAGQR